MPRIPIKPLLNLKDTTAKHPEEKLKIRAMIAKALTVLRSLSLSTSSTKLHSQSDQSDSLKPALPREYQVPRSASHAKMLGKKSTKRF